MSHNNNCRFFHCCRSSSPSSPGSEGTHSESAYRRGGVASASQLHTPRQLLADSITFLSMNPLRVFRASRWLAADWRRRAGCRMALSSSWLRAPMITCTDLGSVTVLQLKTLISRTSLPYLPDRKQLYASWTLTPQRICPYLDISIMKYNGCHRKWHTEKSHAFLYIENKQTSSA